MTGADRFAELLARVEFALRETPEHLRLSASLTMIAGWSIELAAALIEQDDYSSACDVITMANALLVEGSAEYRRQLFEHGTEQDKKAALGLLSRVFGADVPIPDDHDPDVAAAIDANALSDEELRALGLEPGDGVDAPGEVG